MLSSVIDVTYWHINTDEPRALGYNEEFKTPDQIISWYGADPYRSSDHDPVIINFQLESPTDLAITKLKGHKSKKGRVHVKLRWNGGSGQQVEIYRNDQLIAIIENDGKYFDKARFISEDLLVYKICEINGSCSAEQNIELRKSRK